MSFGKSLWRSVGIAVEISAKASLNSVAILTAANIVVFRKVSGTNSTYHTTR